MEILYLVVLAIAIFIICFQVNRYLNDRKFYNSNDIKSYNKVLYNKATLIMYLIFVVYAIISMIFLAKTNNDTYLASGIILVFAFGEILNFKTNFYLYYNEQYVIIKNKKFKIKDISNVTIKKNNSLDLKVVSSNEIYSLPYILLQQLVQYKHIKFKDLRKK